MVLLLMKDDGRRDDGDLYNLFSRMATEVSILGKPLDSYGSREEYVLDHLEALSNDRKFLETEGEVYHIFERDDSVIAVQEDFEEIKAIQTPKIPVASNFDYGDYKTSIASDLLLDYIDGSHEAVGELKSFEIEEGEEIEVFEELIEEYR